MGFRELPPGSKPRVGWLVNMVPSTIEEPSTRRPVQAVDLFFISDDEEGDFRVSIVSRPYLYLGVAPSMLREIDVALRRKFPDEIADISIVRLEDTTRMNHLAKDTGFPFLKVETRTLGELYSVRFQLTSLIKRNRESPTYKAILNSTDNHNATVNPSSSASDDAVPFNLPTDPLDAIFDMREYDVAPVNRLAIDNRINVGYWYKVWPAGSEHSRHDNNSSSAQQSYEEELLDGMNDPNAHLDLDPDLNEGHANDLFSAHLKRLPEIVERASPVVLAYDIECTKKPLKFPDPVAGDQVMMISWMVDGSGYLAINREVVSADIEDFEFNPHKEYKGAFKVFNENDEKAVLERFFSEVRIAAPRVFATFNGDFFDWPFVETRAAIHGLDMGKEIGMHGTSNDNSFGVAKETKGRTAIHMDVLHWVNRDSYLPQGSRGLKAVTRVLLGFEPEEIPPEEMMQAAKERPIEMATYSVSDAVCTYYLYMKYVHPFIFSLCTILPLNPDDVLRKGSGTLCEMLLMCQAKERRIVAPNKHNETALGKLTEDGHVLESETYIGGHVEAIRTGVFRSDIPLQFNIDVGTIDDLEKCLDDTLHFAITVEGKTKMEDVTNYEEVRAQIVKELNDLRENPIRAEKPLIYHLDVSAMYPNIILTNRLQPHAIVTPEQCAACDFNGTSDCQRDMEWTWRGEFFPASRGEAEMIQRRAAAEHRETERKKMEEAAKESINDVGDDDGDRSRHWKRQRPTGGNRGNGKGFNNNGANLAALMSFDNIESRRNPVFRARLKEYCRVNYKKVHQTRQIDKTATVCQRENSFYVDTVRAFRDRRYEYKGLLKKQKKAKAAAKESGDTDAYQRADKLVVLYDSLQLAHKCILNSFYGYVMRKGARWFSMEMAGIVTNTGGLIIRRAREFIDKVGLPLELDTDGIWCVLPVSFPENFNFTTRSGKKCSMSYICSLFNADVAANFTNHQYQDLVDSKTFEYSQRSECSILFEVDGPYKAMVLPASLEEGKSIKKRYAVFNDDGSIAELKGFEIKRRGELKLVKQFQGEIFDRFLKGDSLIDCYSKVGDTCNKWLDILTSQGEGMSDQDLLELLVEQNNMSKTLDEYITAKQKSCAITCATRMQEFLGAEIVRDKGLATMYVVAKKPDDTQVTARAVPVKIFEFKNEAVRRRLLRKWLKTTNDSDLELRNMLDWEYYKGRLANAILKIVSIPAAMQGVDNPVPRIEYPPWLMKRVREFKDQRKQRTMSSFFNTLPKGAKPQLFNFKSLKDASVNNTENMDIEDIEDLPLRQWTAAETAHRKAKATISHKMLMEKMSKKQKPKSSSDRRMFRSTAHDPATRALETRDAMLKLLYAPHPSIRQSYAGWLRHAKKVWRAQRAARVFRYALRRRALGIPLYGEEEKVEEPDEEPEKPKKGEPFGGQSLAVKFGVVANTRKKRLLDPSNAPDYFPSHFIVDLNRRVDQTFFKSTSVPLVGAGVVWQIVSIASVHERPGEFKLWVLPARKNDKVYNSGDLHCIPLHVNRVLYYNSKVEDPPQIPGVSCEPVRGLTLPRSQPYHTLFRLVVNEARFQSTDQDLASILTDAGTVDGVFGSRCPLEYEVIVALGNLCVPSRMTAIRTKRDLIQKGVNLEDITPKNLDAVPYLQSQEKSSYDDYVLNEAFLYGSHALDGTKRAMYILVAAQAKIVHAIVVTPAGNVNMNLKRLWRNFVDKRKKDLEEANVGEYVTNGDHLPSLPSDCQFYVNAATTREDAWSQIQIILSRLRSGNGFGNRGRPTGLRTVLLTQWPEIDSTIAEEALFGSSADKSSSAKRVLSCVEECVPITKSFPIVRLPNNANDGNYMPVGWEATAVTTGFSRFADVSNWLSSQLMLAKFAGIPIGNVSSMHVHSQAIDVLVGRELINCDQVLWASDSALPDLGGLEEDDNNLQNEFQSVPEISMPGSYRTICIDMELSNLAIATILSSSQVNQIEGTDMAFDAVNSGASSKRSDGIVPITENTEANGASASPLDEMASSAPAFRVLKDLVSTWDKIVNSDTKSNVASVARGLLDHVHRWTRSESSMLYDPALARFLAWLVRKVFRQLINELRSLGANVVYASMSRMILATPKMVTLDGLRYAGFLEKTIKEKGLFKHIMFQPLLGVYAGLLFMDRFNYADLPVPEEMAIISGDASKLQANNPSNGRRIYASEDIPEVRVTWDIARYLPTPVALLWVQAVSEFIRRPMVLRLREELNNSEDGIEIEDASTKDENAADPNKEESKPAEPAKKQRNLRPRGDGFREEVKTVIKRLTPQLLEKVHEIREKAPTLQFPNVPSVLQAINGGNRNCALEFVRCLCHVLSLDNACTEEVASMRRSLLQVLGVREFAKEGRFIEPALPVPLHDVICKYCNAVVDLDVARDSRLWSSDEDDQNVGNTGHGRKAWACEYCGDPYDLRVIEMDLVRIAQKTFSSYQVQDLLCVKCRLVKKDHMSTHCGCAGAPYQLTMKKEALHNKMFSLKSVAEFHKFELLDETVGWMLDSMSDTTTLA